MTDNEHYFTREDYRAESDNGDARSWGQSGNKTLHGRKLNCESRTFQTGQQGVCKPSLQTAVAQRSRPALRTSAQNQRPGSTPRIGARDHSSRSLRLKTEKDANRTNRYPKTARGTPGVAGWNPTACGASLRSVHAGEDVIEKLNALFDHRFDCIKWTP